MFILYFLHLIATSFCYGDLGQIETENEILVKPPLETNGVAAGRATSGSATYGLRLDDQSKTGQKSLRQILQDEAETEEAEAEAAAKKKAGVELKEGEEETTFRADNVVAEDCFAEDDITSKADVEKTASRTSLKSGNKVSPMTTTTSTATMKDNDKNASKKWEMLRFLLNDNYLCLLFGDFTAWFCMMVVLTIAFPVGEQ